MSTPTITVREIAEEFGYEDFAANDDQGRPLDHDAECTGCMPVDPNTIAVYLTDKSKGNIQRVPPIET